MPSADANLNALRASANSDRLQFVVLTKVVDVVGVAMPDAVLVVQDEAMFMVRVEEVVDEVVVPVLVVEALEDAPVVSRMAPPEVPMPPPTHSYV